MLKSHQLVCASLLLAVIGKVKFLDFLDQPISSLLSLLPDPAPGPFLHFTAQCWEVGQTTTCSGNQIKENILCLVPLILNRGNMHRCWWISDKSLDQYIPKHTQLQPDLQPVSQQTLTKIGPDGGTCMEADLLFGPNMQFWTFENVGADPQFIKSPVAPLKSMEQ